MASSLRTKPPSYPTLGGEKVADSAIAELAHRAQEDAARRAAAWTAVRRRNTRVALGLAASVLGVYFYSMYAIKQERFLEDIQVTPPAKKEN